MNLIPIDESNVYIAEKSFKIGDLKAALKEVGQFHTYHEWDEAFLSETVDQVKTLRVGEALEESLYSKVENGSQQVRIKLIRKDETSTILRLTTSDKDLSQRIQNALDRVR